jgi:hypothetical protein
MQGKGGDKPALTIVHVYLQTIVDSKKYSHDGEYKAALALWVLDGDVAMRIYEMYREQLPVMSEIPHYAMEREIQKLEKTLEKARQSDLDFDEMMTGLDLSASFYPEQVI